MNDAHYCQILRFSMNRELCSSFPCDVNCLLTSMRKQKNLGEDNEDDENKEKVAGTTKTKSYCLRVLSHYVIKDVGFEPWCEGGCVF